MHLRSKYGWLSAQRTNSSLEETVGPTWVLTPKTCRLARSIKARCLQSQALALHLRALAWIDEAIDHAEVVERVAEGAALASAGAGWERAVIGRPLAAGAIAATAAAGGGEGAQLQGVWRGLRDGVRREGDAGGQLGAREAQGVSGRQGP